MDWSPDGRHLAVTDNAPAFGTDLRVLAVPVSLRTNDIEFDVTADGSRFLLVEPAEQTAFLPLSVILNGRGSDGVR